jgi:hypothetical protein
MGPVKEKMGSAPSKEEYNASRKMRRCRRRHATRHGQSVTIPAFSRSAARVDAPGGKGAGTVGRRSEREEAGGDASWRDALLLNGSMGLTGGSSSGRARARAKAKEGGA